MATATVHHHRRENAESTDRSDADGNMLCNDCAAPVFWCDVRGWYFHVEPTTPACFLATSDHPYAWTAAHEQHHTYASAEARAEFMLRLREFYRAGMRLVEAWDADGFNADAEYPLPARIAPPLSLDEWLDELLAHYGEES